MTTGSSSQKGVFKIPGKEGSVFTVNLPDGSPRYILLQEVDGLVRLLEENYQGGKEPINPIEELDGLISIIKQNSNTVDAPENTTPNQKPVVNTPPVSPSPLPETPTQQEPEEMTEVQVGISPHTEGDQRATEFYTEEERSEKTRANSLMRPPKLTEQGEQELDEEEEPVYLEPSAENAEEAQSIYSDVAQKGTQHLQTALDEAGFEGFTVTPNFGLFGSTYEPSIYVQGSIREDQRDQFMELIIGVADTDFDQKSVIVHEAYEGDDPEFGVVEGGQGEAIEPVVSLTFERELSAKEFNDLGKILNEISDGTIGFASRPDGMGMDILNLSVYNTDYIDFIKTVREFIDNDETERISGANGADVGRARRTWTIGKESGPAGYYSEGRYEELDEYDGLISYEEYRSYLSSKKETSEESGKVGLNPTPYTQTDPPSSNEEREERAESQESVPPVSDDTPVAPKYDTTALDVERPINSKEDIIQLWQVNEGTSSPVASTYAGNWTILREVQRRTESEEPQLCMQAAHMAARVNNGKFVQGTVIGSEGKRISHAWAEIGDYIYDAVTGGGGIIEPIDSWYEQNSVEDVRKLTSLEAEELHYENDPPGLWGPYEDEEIAEVRKDDKPSDDASLEQRARQRQQQEYSDIEELDLVTEEDFDIDTGIDINKVISMDRAKEISEENKELYGKAYELSDLDKGPEFINVFHGTNASGAQRIIETGQLGYQRNERASATGTGFHLDLTEARGFAGAKNIDADADTREDVMPVILQFQLPVSRLEEWGFHSDPHAGGEAGGAFISPEIVELPEEADIKVLSGLGRNFSLVENEDGEEGVWVEGIPSSLVLKQSGMTLDKIHSQLNNLVSKQMLEENPTQQMMPTTAVPSPGDKVYVSQNPPPSEDVSTYTGTRGGEYWLRSQAMSAMDWNEDQMNEYLNTENEEIQSESLEDLQAQQPELVDQVRQLRAEKNRKYRVYGSARRALDRGEVSAEEVEERKNAYRASKDAWEESRVELDLLNEKIEGLTSDAIEMPSEETPEQLEPELDNSIENLEELLKDDPEVMGDNKSDVLAILEHWSSKEQQARTEIDETHNDEYYAHPDVQSAVTAVSRVAEKTNWRNLEMLSEMPMVANMILDGNLDQKISVLSTRLDAYKTIGNTVLEHFEENYSLPSFDIKGNPSDKDWRQTMNASMIERILRKGPDANYVWFNEEKLNQKIQLSQMSNKNASVYRKQVNDAAALGVAPPSKDTYYDQFDEITFRDILWNLDAINARKVQNEAKGTETAVSISIRTSEGEKVRKIKISAAKLDDTLNMVLNELPDKFGPPSVSNAFRNKFAAIVDPDTDNPATDTDNIVAELYGATKFGKFHAESSSEMEKSTNSLLGGLIKDVIGDLTGSKIIHHGSKTLRDRNGNLVALDEGYERFPKAHVAEYVRTHKQLTRQLLDFMYPDSDAVETYRGTQDAKLTAFGTEAITSKRDGFIQRLMNRGSKGAKLMVQSNPVTTYSSNPLAAYDFATDLRAARSSATDIDAPVSETAQGQGGLILVHQVPKEDIWSSYGTGHAGSFRQGTEREFYVANTRGKPYSTVTAYLPSDFYDYIMESGGSFQKQQELQEQLQQDDREDKNLVLIIEDDVNSDWIQTVHELWADHPDLGEHSNMPAIRVGPSGVDGPYFDGQKTGMPKIPVEQREIVETTPTVQKSYVVKQQELGQTLAQAEPDTATTPTEEAPVHPAAQGKVRTVIFELVNRAGRTFERRRTAWVNPKVAEAINSRQKATDWLRLLGNYLPLYFVGGFVRDKLMGKVSSDVDIISLAPLDEVEKTFKSLNIDYKRVSAKDKKILTLKVAGMDVDVAAAEAEDLPKDLMKRDFTINAVAQSVTGQFYDPSNGLADIKNKVLRSPRNQSDKRFQEDPIRMLRAARFIGNYKLKIHPSVIRAIKKNKDKLKDMPKGRMGRELAKMMETERPHDAMEFLAEHDLLEAIDPSLSDMVGYKQNTHHHKWDLWKHTMTALKKAESEDMVLNLAILFHDIGKPDAADEKQSTFHGHEKDSAKHTARILKDLGFPEDLRKRVANLVEMHMRLLTIPETAKEGAFRRLKMQAGEDLNRLIKLAQADSAGSGVEIDRKLQQLDVIIAKIKNTEDAPDKKNLSPLSGEEIMSQTGVEEGPQIGEIKEHLHNLVIDGELDAEDKKEAVKQARNYMSDISKQLDTLVKMLSNA